MNTTAIPPTITIHYYTLLQSHRQSQQTIKHYSNFTINQ